MLIIIDNTKNLKKAYMTPKLLNYLNKIKIKYLVASTRLEVNRILDEYKKEIKGAILTGGPLCLSEELTITSINKNIAILLELKNIPVLGICFGFQIMAASYGGEIKSMKKEESGIFKINILRETELLNGLSNNFNVYQSHKDTVIQLPKSFNIIGIDDNNKIQIIENIKEKRWGVQFHPEGLESTNVIIQNFVNICYI